MILKYGDLEIPVACVKSWESTPVRDKTETQVIGIMHTITLIEATGGPGADEPVMVGPKE